MKNKIILITTTIICIIAIIGCIIYKSKIFADEIKDYREYYIDETFKNEDDFQDNYYLSNDKKYKILNYQEYIAFCNQYNITDNLYTNNNINYMIVWIKEFSRGIEHHNFKIFSENQIISLHDEYTWGATGDVYGEFLCIPLKNNEIKLNYINKFMQSDEN